MKKTILKLAVTIIIGCMALMLSGIAYAHGVICEQKMVGENTLRVTLKWSDPNEQKGIVIRSYGIREGKYIDITYEAVDGKPNTYTKDFDIRSLLPKPCIKLYNIKSYSSPIFPDTKGHYSEDYIHHLHDLGVINGRPDGTFAPDNTVSRAEFAKMMVIALSLSGTVENTNGYTDINGHWARNYILLAVKNGLISGYSDKTVRPDNPITVAEISTIISRAYAFKTSKSGIYTKLRQNMWYTSYVKKMFDAGILTINDSIYGSFDENIYINRANCSMMVSRAMTTY